MWGWLPGRLILSGPCSWVRAGRGAAARGKQGGWLVLWCLACVVGAPACVGVCGGGMLSGFWGSAPWLPDPSGLLICCWGLWVGVGGLVVNCIVDASILL